MQEQELIALLERYRTGVATEEDLVFLESWYLSDDNASVDEYGENFLLEDASIVWNRLNKPLVRWYRWIPYTAAACIALFFIVRTFLFQPADDIRILEVEGPLSQSEKLMPEKDGDNVMLTFSDGSSVKLDDEHRGIQMLDNHIYYKDGDGLLNVEKYEYVTVSVPHGGQYQVTLSDGSIVVLNAASSLRYPVVFKGEERKVELSGEAYFTVAKQPNNVDRGELKPFIVAVGDYQVQVHGTQFNVQGYSPALSTKVSLVTGKVSVHGKGPELEKGVFLVPGLQAHMKGERVAVRKVDVQHEIAWKNGLFSFEGKKLTEVMDELARWYNVDVEYEGEVPNVSFFGRAHRSEKLIAILHLLKSADITYRLTTYDGQRKSKLVIVNKRKEGK